MKKLLFAAFAAMALMASCATADKVTLIEVQEPTRFDGSSIDLCFTVENLNAQTIKLKDAKVDVISDGKVIVRAIPLETIVIPKRSTSEITVPMSFKVQNLLGALSIAQSTEKMNAITVSGEVIVKCGMLRKKYKFNDLPLRNIASTFGGEAKSEK